jgi:signal transduction histidine kinase/AraC-like DNA-binding protein/ligand-binding sensor domain-containing protein
VKTIISYLVLICLFFPSQKSLYGQKILYPDYNPPNIRWDNFLLKEGEASQFSSSILIDSKGFLWSGTETGLYRFDGSRYVEYGVSRGTDQGFAGFEVNCIFEDSEGTIWIGTSAALNKLDQGTGKFTHYMPEPSGEPDYDNFIRGIQEDRDGLLWIVTKKHIYSFNRKTKKFIQYITDSLSWYPQIYYAPFNDQYFTEDRLGNKWFVTFRGLYKFDQASKTFGMVLPQPDNNMLKGITGIKCVSADKDGTLWLGTAGEGLLRWDPSLNKPEKIIPTAAVDNPDAYNTVSSILPDRNGTVWSFGNGSFSNFNPIDNSIKYYTIVYREKTLYEYNLKEVAIDQAFQAGDGSIWFLNKLSGLMFRFCPQTEKLSLYRVPYFAVLQCFPDHSGTFWFACVRNNVFRMVGREHIPFISIPVDNGSHVSQIHRGCFLEDQQQNVYFLFLTGIYMSRRFDATGAVKLDRFRFPDGDSIAGGGFRDSKGNFWFGDKKGNIVKYEPYSRKLTRLTHNKSPGYTEVLYVPLIREDKAGNIWVATANNLRRIHPVTGQFDQAIANYGNSVFRGPRLLMDFLIDTLGTFWIVTSESIQSISMPEMRINEYTDFRDGISSSSRSNIRVAEDSRGTVFILNARYGVYQFDRRNGTFIKVNLADEEPGSEYYDLLVDRLDRLWVAHNRGITIYDRSNNSTRNIKTPKLQFDIQSFQLSSGEILILNNNQLYIFDESLPSNQHIPPVYLTRLLLNGKDQYIFKGNEYPSSAIHEIRLPFRMNTLSFEFAALNYLNPERNRYRYFMEGYDRDTSLVEQGMTADYRNMPPGRYTFWVTGSNNDGLWHPSGISLNIRIYPPWYRTAIAYMSYLAVIALLIYVYIRRREYNLINDKIRLESEIKAATAELERKNLQLAEIDRIKTHFFTDIAHEIRTPLSLILGPIEQMSKEGTDDRKMPGMVDLMKRNAHRLMNLVNQLLDISRLDAGKMKITLTEDDIVKFIRMLVYEFLSLADTKQIKYIADLPEMSFIVLFDRDKIEKIITNLLSNAFKYTPRNGTVHCIIRIETGNNNVSPLLKIRVTDTGHGIGEEHHFKIFERFYRVEGHHETEGYGTGIGLSLVQEFVTLLQGEIRVASAPGKGSDFSVIIPLGKGHLSPEDYVIAPTPSSVPENRVVITHHDRRESETGNTVPKGRMQLLIIEDNEDLRTFIRQTLDHEYVIFDSENGKTGLNTAFTMMPDLIVTDIMMPDIDGLELCAILKNDERTSHIPVIMLTAKSTSEDKIAGLKTGADDYVVKPFNMTELSARISNLLVMRSRLKQKYSRFHLPEERKKPPESVDDRFMMRVIKTINAKIGDDAFDVGALTEHLGMSRTHLTRKLKILTGMSPGTIIRNIRLEKAAELLLEKTGNITEVANTVGISNPSHFTRAFRHYFGVSPRKYLNRPVP